MAQDSNNRGLLAALGAIFEKLFETIFDSEPEIETVSMTRTTNGEVSESEQLLEQKMDMFEEMMDRHLF
jgi:hypothetical protein